MTESSVDDRDDSIMTISTISSLSTTLGVADPLSAHG